MKFEIKTLGELSIGKKGSYGIAASAVEYSPNLYTYLRITDINDDGTLKKDGLMSVDDDKASEYLLKPNDIVFARTGASTGRNYFYDGSDGEFVYAGFLIRFSIDEEKVNPYYIKYYCQSDIYKQWVQSFNTGSTRGNINAKTYCNMPIHVPPKKQQDFLVSVLKPIDDKIAVNNEINKNLEEQAQAIFDSFYERANSEVPFTSIIQILGGGTPKTKEESYWNGDIPFFTPKDVGNPYTLSTEKFITSTGLENCNSRLYPINTTFVTARGTVGKVSLAGVPMAMNQSCYALSGNNIHPLMTYFYTLKTVQSLRHKASGAVFDAIVTSDFKSEILRCISENDSMQLLNSIEPMMDRILQGSVENTRLAQLRDTLLPRLMSGEIDVSSIEV